MSDTIKVICIEDNESDFALIARELKRSDLNLAVERLDTKEVLLDRMLYDRPQLVISDNDLPGFSGLEAQKLVQQYDEELPFILVSGAIDEASAVQAMRSGAKDYILKDNLSRLLPAVEREVHEYELRLEQRLNQKQLILSELRYQFLTESIQEVFFALNDELKFTYWNRTAERVFQKNDVVGKHINAVFPEWQQNKLIDCIELALTSAITVPLKFVTTTSKREHFKGKAYPSDDGVSVVLSNVTEETEYKNKLLRINHELETLLYRISHDLKGPVASVMGLIQIAERDASFTREDFVRMMRRNMRTLNHTMTELLDISRIKFGEQKKKSFRILPVLKELKANLSFLSGYPQVDLIFLLSEGLTLTSSPMLFKSIWQNLIENAIKYQKKEGRTQVIIEAVEHKEGVLFQITDTGQGIPHELKNKIFQMFFRGNEQSSGSGLGLYIVKSALDKIGGSIKLDKSYRNGARFAVYMPNSLQEPASRKEPKPTTNEQNN